MKLILGTVQLGLEYGINNSTGKPSIENAFNILDEAYLAGIRELDTADAYGNATEVLAAYLAKFPDKKIKIMSKFIANKHTRFEDTFENCCKGLGLTSLDGLYFHRFEDFKAFKHFDYIKELKSQKRLGKLGVSLYSLEDLQLAVDSADVDLIQLSFNIFDREEEKVKLLKMAKSQGKLIYIRSAFLQGLFFKNPNELSVKLNPLKESLLKLHEVKNTFGVSMEDLCLRFATDQDYIDGVVIGVDSVEQLKNNINSLNKKLPDHLLEEVLKIKIDFPELLNPTNWNN